MSTVVLYCWCHSDSASVLLYFTLTVWIDVQAQFCILNEEVICEYIYLPSDFV